MRQRSNQNRFVRGFTLVEILVAMTLLSIVMLALGASMRTIAQTESRVDDRLQRADQMRVAQGFLASTLGRVSPRKSEVSTRAGASLYLLVASSDVMMWVGVMPARYGSGGRHFFRLGLEPSGTSSALVIRFLPWTGTAAFPDWSRAPFRVLVPDVSMMTMEYSDDKDGDLSWLADWPYPDRIPGGIRISLATSSGDWPFLTFPLRLMPAGDRGRGGFSLGPE